MMNRIRMLCFLFLLFPLSSHGDYVGPDWSTIDKNMTPTGPDWSKIDPQTEAEKDAGYDAGKMAAKSINSEIRGQMGERINEPMTSDGSPLKTFEATGKGFDGARAAVENIDIQLSPVSSNIFLDLFARPSSTGDLDFAVIRQDLDFNDHFDYAYNVPFPISGICKNGVISCVPGTWANCSYWKWHGERVTLQNRDSAPSFPPYTIEDMQGCYCINSSCGSSLAWTNLNAIIRDLGDGAVEGIKEQNPKYCVTNVELTTANARYYGFLTDDTDQAGGTVFSGIPNPERYFDGGKGNPPWEAERTVQELDPDSLFNLVKESGDADSLEIEIIDCYQKTTVRFVRGTIDVDHSENCSSVSGGCILREEKICDQNNRNCIFTVERSTPTGLTPLPYCYDLTDGPVTYTFCATGTELYYRIPPLASTVTLETGSNLWWNVSRVYECPSGRAFDASGVLARVARIQSSVSMSHAGVASYQDYDPTTGSVVDRSFTYYQSDDPPITCEQACKLTKTVDDNEVGTEGKVSDFRINTTAEQTIVRVCVDGVCPIEAGETVVQNCECLDDFNESLSSMQSLRDASKDVVCSTK